ncbi:MAG: hypothetical protein MZV70_50990 [Desulfobacterales bacterium]|nr:hypothetical protein [Desulfobacterales bacterium]
MPKDSGLGQGMCQKVIMVALGSSFAEHARQQGKMVVLHKDNGIFPFGFLDNGVGKTLIDRHIVLPVAGSEDGTHMGDMAKRP